MTRSFSSPAPRHTSATGERRLPAVFQLTDISSEGNIKSAIDHAVKELMNRVPRTRLVPTALKCGTDLNRRLRVQPPFLRLYSHSVVQIERSAINRACAILLARANSAMKRKPAISVSSNSV